MTATEESITAETPPTPEWVVVCAADRIRPDRGVAVLLGDQPVAVFRLSAVDAAPEEWCAVSHLDPVTGAPVMARGLVGSVAEDGELVPTVASPLHKQRYDLRSGRCLDELEVSLTTFPVRVHAGMVEVGQDVTRM